MESLNEIIFCDSLMCFLEDFMGSHDVLTVTEGLCGQEKVFILKQ